MVQNILNFNLKEFNSYRIESFCRRAWFPNNECELLEVFDFIKTDNFVILGNGNNIILSKGYYALDFIIFNKCFNKITVNKNEMVAESGATIYDVSHLALENSLSGFEVLCDIPSSVGGAVVMNAGTKEGEICDIISKVRYLDLNTRSYVERNTEEFAFGYRNSIFQNCRDKIVVKVWFKLNHSSYQVIKDKMENVRSIRWAKQPRDLPNCGSVFKRPPGKFVGPMLDELGLKGYTIGGAQVSKKHSGFIVNLGNASGSDILSVIQVCQIKVLEKFGINLDVEQRII